MAVFFHCRIFFLPHSYIGSTPIGFLSLATTYYTTTARQNHQNDRHVSSKDHEQRHTPNQIRWKIKAMGQL
ncbi:hypothetical protein BJX96DRAFT_128174 [Aspergillus floccosus]